MRLRDCRALQAEANDEASPHPDRQNYLLLSQAEDSVSGC
jgi:hypothetical protein